MKNLRLFQTLVCFVFSIAVSYSTTYYVNSVSGLDSNDGITASSPFSTLGQALDMSDVTSILLMGDGTYYVTANSSYGSRVLYNDRQISSDLIIEAYSGTPTLQWDITTGYGSVTFADQWYTCFNVVRGGLTLDGLILDFTGIYELALKSCFYFTEGTYGSFKNCIFRSYVDEFGVKNYYFNLEDADVDPDVSISYSFFDDIVSSTSDNMSFLVPDASAHPSINPFYFDESMTDVYHVYGTVDDIIYGDPSWNVNLEINDPASEVTIPNGTYLDINVAADVDVNIASGSTVSADACNFVSNNIVTLDGSLSLSSMELNAGSSLTGNGSLSVQNMTSTTTDAITLGSVTFTESGNSSISGTITAASFNLNSTSSVSVDTVNVETNGTLSVDGSLSVIKCNAYSSSAIDISSAGSIESELFSLATNSSIEVSGALMSTDLIINDQARLVNLSSNTNVSGNVSILGDVFVQSQTSFGNASTTLQLEFEREAFEYFTPPFTISASDLGTVETDQYATGVASSVWLYDYDEPTEANDPSDNAWLTMTSSEQLSSGQGYCIWVNSASGEYTRTITLSASSSYPNVSDLISAKVQYTVPATTTSGMNALGNSYSLPLVLPINSEVSVYYYHDGDQYITMTGDDGIVVGGSQADFTIPSYASFFASVNSADALSFSYSDLDNTSSVTRSLPVAKNSATQYIRVAVANDTAYDDCVMRFKEGASFGVDEYDIDKMYDPNGKTPIEVSVSTSANVGDYAVMSFPEFASLSSGELFAIPYNLTIKSIGSYEVTSSLTGLNTNEVDVFLYDEIDNVSIQLNETDPYTLVIDNVNDAYGRYNIIAVKNAVTDVDEYASTLPCEVFIGNHTLQVSLESNTAADMKIFDTSGRLVHTSSFEGNHTVSLSSLSAGVYVLSLLSSDGLFYTEKIINQ